MPATREKTGECRQCRSFCDKMVEPRGCVEMRCRYLYSFVDMLTGSQYVGCMQDVFAAKVDLEAVLQPGGFGGVKMTGEALPHCQFSVEQAYEGDGRVLRLRQPPLLRLLRRRSRGHQGLRPARRLSAALHDDTVPCTIPRHERYSGSGRGRERELVAEAAGGDGSSQRGTEVHARAEPGPEGHPRVGARLRRGRRPSRRRGMGRARGDALAGDPGGRQDRPLQLRSARPVLGRRDRPDAADRQRGALLGRRRHRHGDHGHLAGRRRDLRAGNPGADGRVDPAVLRQPPTTPRSPPSAPRSRTPAPTSRRSAPPPSTTRRPTSG